LIPFCLFGVFLPVWLLVNIKAKQLALAMGLFVMEYALYPLLPTKSSAGPRLWAIPFGGLGGFMGALFGSSGLVYVTYLKLRPLNKVQFRATIAMVLILVGLLFPVLLLSIKFDNHLNLNISQSRFNLMVSTLLMVSGAVLVHKSM
jgi:uncharacterized membrane protein YfcA